MYAIRSYYGMKSATFPGRFKSLAKISKFVIEAAKKAGLDDKAIYAVELAVDEAASNIIEHAYGGDVITSYSIHYTKLYDYGVAGFAPL